MSSIDLSVDNDFEDDEIDEIEELVIEDEESDENEKMEEEGDIDNIDEDEFSDKNEDEETEESEDIIEIIEEKRIEINKDNVTVPFITKYEYPKILAIRSQQIASGAPIYLDEKKHNLLNKKPLEVAEMELKEGWLNNIIIKRKLPNGKIERRRLSELKIIDFY